MLERCIDVAYQRGEKLYFVRLGLIGLQRAFHLSGPLLRGSWAAIRGWRVLQPVRSRVPMSKSILKALLVVLLATGKSFTGRAREGYWAAMLATWVSFEGLLRPGSPRRGGSGRRSLCLSSVLSLLLGCSGGAKVFLVIACSSGWVVGSGIVSLSLG